MANEKNNIPTDLQAVIDACPYPTVSEFEREHFQSQSGPGYARYVVEVINRIRKIDSDLVTTTTAYESNCLHAERNKLVDFLKDQELDEVKAATENWEFYERDYWANYLGKQAAIEILTLGKTTVETMTKMVRLPEDLYVKATQICVKLANTVKAATVEAEQEIGFSEAEEFSSADRIVLKKVK